MNYIIQNKINLKLLQILSALLFIFILPNITYADNLYGGACGTLTCGQNEVCQKQYRGVLPIGSQNDGNATYTCVKPQAISAPASPYKGSEGCAEGPGGGIFGGILGDTVNGLVGNGLTGLVGGVKLIGAGGGAFGLPSVFTFVNPSGVITDTLLNGLNSSTNFNNLIGFVGAGGDDCKNYNNIDRVIDTRRLTAPLPVDIFNPLPLPVNITSPTPLPVVVVDDLALYQQKELIDAPLAAQQKAKTIATVSDTLRYQISNDSLIPDNYFALESLGWQYGALDPTTGVVSKEAIDKYGSYQNFSLDKNKDIEQYFKDLQDQKSQLPDENFTQNCGNVKTEDAGEVSFECALLGLQPNNNANDIAFNIAQVAAEKSQNATELLDQEVRDGSGYFAKTADGDKNPFTKTIQTPGSNIESLTNKVLESTVDQAITASGDNCFEAIPNNILEGSLKPVLTQGLFGVNNTLASVQKNVTSNPVNSLQNPSGFANQLTSGLQGAIPDPNKFFKSLQNSLLQNVTNGLSCELNKQVSGLLNGALGNINIPGIGNVSGAINNAATGAINNAVNGLIP
jgi:hypothetical protein